MNSREASTPPQNHALAGLRVLELGQLIAGPFAASMLANFGAEVIKIEAPGVGDPLRKWRKVYEGTSLWWRVMGRNKKSVTLDLRRAEAQALLRKVIAEGKIDILIENFRPGRMEAWGLGWEALHRLDPRLVMVRVSGWGQTGPRAQEPGFANIAESAGGMRYLSGEPGRPPVRAGISIGDSLAGMHAAFGVMAAIHHRNATGEGQMVDVALHESVFNMLESLLPEYDLLGHQRERSGTRLEGIAPTNTYACKEGKYVVIGANSDSMFERLMRAIDRPDLAVDPELARNDGRVAQQERLDQEIEKWTRERELDEVLRVLREAEVAVGPIQSIADITEDPQFLARDVFDSVTLPTGEKMKIPGVLPKLSGTPGATRWIGSELGEHTSEMLQKWGMKEAAIEAWKREGIA